MSQSQPVTQHYDPMPGEAFFFRSYAKINLTLDVLGKRSDGYHELATIMQTIDIYDTISFTTLAEDRVHMVCNRLELSNDDNLIVRAVQAIRSKLGLTHGISIELNKRIPIAAGLGGGSGNAAATLCALTDWWKLPLSSQDLWELAASLGSDVPFFLTGGLALCEGRGELITPLAPHWPSSLRWLLLLKPPISVSTAMVFRHLTVADYTDGIWSRTLQSKLQGKDHFQAEDLFNSLEKGVLAVYPEVAQARQDMLQCGAANVRLSGSGPTLFSLFPTLQSAAQVQQTLQKWGYETYLTHAIHTDGSETHFF